MKALLRTLPVALVFIGVLAGGAWYYTTRIAADPPPNLRTTSIKRGDVCPTISATGTVEPEEFVDVGAQVMGPIKSFGIDPSDPAKKKSIDYGSAVHEGTVLAYIDPQIYQAQVDQAEAAVNSSKADLEQAQAKLNQAEADWKRAEALRAANQKLRQTDDRLVVISDAEYDLARANHDVAKANLSVAKAAILQKQAGLKLAKTNLDYTVIKSPVEGVIIDRRMNVGQTVVATLNAPSLFLVAKDLHKMQVWASVNEADIGRIHVGQPVRFTVDAYPGETFPGKVGQVRLNAQMTQNVVLFTVVVLFDNSDLKLKPYLTANVQFELERRENVLVVPNAALRWKPRQEQVAPEARETVFSASSGERAGKRTQPAAKSPGDQKPARPAKEREERARLWVKADDERFVRPIEVQIGATDGSLTEVSGSDLTEGMEVAVGEARAEQVAEAVKNPFGPPQIPRRELQKGPPPPP